VPDDPRRLVGQLTTRQLDLHGNQLTRCLKALDTDAPIRADVQRELATVRAEQPPPCSRPHPHNLHGGEVGNMFGSTPRVNSQEGGPIRNRTEGGTGRTNGRGKCKPKAVPPAVECALSRPCPQAALDRLTELAGSA
jgi:hypothetical protein